MILGQYVCLEVLTHLCLVLSLEPREKCGFLRLQSPEHCIAQKRVCMSFTCRLSAADLAASFALEVPDWPRGSASRLLSAKRRLLAQGPIIGSLASLILPLFSHCTNAASTTAYCRTSCYSATHLLHMNANGEGEALWACLKTLRD